MFRFHELTLLGWDLWPQVRVPLDRDVVLVTGPNGSGKTTLLDAIRQLLNARQLSSKRRIQHYLRAPDRPVLIRAVVSNQGSNGSPAPFRRERIHSEEVTLACALVPGRGGAPDKRFAVLPGRAEVDDLRRHLLEGREWYAPERYSRVLEHAGVTRSLLQLLAIEQGKTNSMFELSPRDLFRRVLQMLGDQVVLDRYRDARAEYARSRQEVARQADELKLRNADLDRVRREVRQRDDWEEQRDKVAELERRLPAAELQVFIRQRKDAAAKIPELQTKVKKGETECGRRADEIARCSSAAEEARKALADVEQEERQAQDSWGDAREWRATAHSAVQDLEGKALRAAKMAARDLTALQQEEETCRQTLATAEQEAKTTRERVIGLEKRVASLRKGQAVLPETVQATLEALDDAGVKAELFCDLVEVRDETYADAVEAALGDTRYALLVDGADEEEALSAAKANNFPGPVFAGGRADVTERHGPLEAHRGSPSWLPAILERVELNRDGTWRDERGRWTAAVPHRVLGEAGRRIELERAGKELDEARVSETEAGGTVAASRRAYDGAREACNKERNRRQLLKEIEVLPTARQALAAARIELQEAKELLGVAREALKTARDTETAAQRRLDAAERDRDDFQRQHEGEKTKLTQLQQQTRVAEKEIADRAGGVAPKLRELAEREALDGPDTVDADLKRALKRFGELGDPPPPEIRDEERMLRKNVEEIEEHIQARRREQDAAQRELDECRRRYLEVVEGALRDYRERVLRLAEVARVGVDLRIPQLGDSDRKLDEAGIEVSFGFDEKEPLPLGDPSFSGGQQVIAGLILLMAMAETEGRGFFMLDEPFAHLSLDRIDDVGEFLRATRAQFLITAPTTLDRNQLDPASLVVVTRKKRRSEAHAPVPVVAAR